MPAPKGNKNALGNKGGGVRKVEVADLPALGLEMVSWFKAKIAKKEFPFLSAFSREVLDACEETLWTYREDDVEFASSYKKCKELQKEFIIKQTLAGKYNPTFAIFTAKNMTDMRDEKHIKADVNVNKLLSDTYDEL